MRRLLFLLIFDVDSFTRQNTFVSFFKYFTASLGSSTRFFKSNTTFDSYLRPLRRSTQRERVQALAKGLFGKMIITSQRYGDMEWVVLSSLMRVMKLGRFGRSTASGIGQDDDNKVMVYLPSLPEPAATSGDVSSSDTGARRINISITPDELQSLVRVLFTLSCSTAHHCSCFQVCLPCFLMYRSYFKICHSFFVS